MAGSGPGHSGRAPFTCRKERGYPKGFIEKTGKIKRKNGTKNNSFKNIFKKLTDLLKGI